MGSTAGLPCWVRICSIGPAHFQFNSTLASRIAGCDCNQLQPHSVTMRQLRPTSHAGATRSSNAVHTSFCVQHRQHHAAQSSAAPFISTARAASHRRAAPAPCRAEAAGSPATAEAPGTSGKSVPKAISWEMDFCSRPILDERGKKMWELLICDAERNFEHAIFFPNNKINSAEVSSDSTSTCTPPPRCAVFALGTAL